MSSAAPTPASPPPAPAPVRPTATVSSSAFTTTLSAVPATFLLTHAPSPIIAWVSVLMTLKEKAPATPALPPPAPATTTATEVSSASAPTVVIFSASVVASFPIFEVVVFRLTLTATVPPTPADLPAATPPAIIIVSESLAAVTAKSPLETTVASSPIAASVSLFDTTRPSTPDTPVPSVEAPPLTPILSSVWVASALIFRPASEPNELTVAPSPT